MDTLTLATEATRNLRSIVEYLEESGAPQKVLRRAIVAYQRSLRTMWDAQSALDAAEGV